MASVETENKKVVTFLWRIENFSYWDSECHGEKIISPHFTNWSKIATCLHLFPKSTEERNKHLRVQFEIPDDVSVISDCELSFLDGNGSALTTGIIRNPEFKRNTPIDLPGCPTYEEVFWSKRSSFLPHDTLTVRCRLKSYFCDTSRAQYYARSRIDVRRASFLFGVGLLKTLGPDQENEYYVSFNETPSVENAFVFTYSFRGTPISNALLHFKISREDNDEPSLLTCKLSFLNTDKKTIKCFQDRHKFNRSSRPQTWLLPYFPSRQELLENFDYHNIHIEIIASVNNISGTFEYASGGSVDMEADCPIDDFSTTSEASIQTIEQIFDQPDTSQQRNDSVAILREDLLSIYKDQTLYDFELRSGDVSFPVHKNVLSARSPVFRAMFCGDMQEANSTSQDVPDVDTHTLNRMLTFLYSGTVDDLQWESAAKLYYAADKYQVQSLKQECLSILRSGVCVSNVSDILELADRHQDQDMTSFVHDFLLIHYDEIVISREWEKFVERNGSFAGKTMIEICKKKLQK